MKITDAPPLCPSCQNKMLAMYGGGWDYDRWVCSCCDAEYELETSTIYEGDKNV